jgi:hypothetical protein
MPKSFNRVSNYLKPNIMKWKLFILCILWSFLNLTVQAQIFTPSSTIQGSSGNNNVGIGTSVPQYKLDVYGILRLYGTDWINMYMQTASKTWNIGTNNSGMHSSGNNQFFIHDGSAYRFTIQSGSGNVGIGCTSPTSQLTVNGNILAKGIEVLDPLPDCDYVFEPDYKLISLYDLEQYIKVHRHLPEVPSAEAFKDSGVLNLGQMSNILLKKVEELTLYIIEQNKRIETLEKENLNLRKN